MLDQCLLSISSSTPPSSFSSSFRYFTLLNKDNQTVVQSGSRPSILQQLCLLPFQYFSDPKLRAILFPTLVAACYENDENRRVVEQDLSCILLANFIDENVMAQERFVNDL